MAQEKNNSNLPDYECASLPIRNEARKKVEAEAIRRKVTREGGEIPDFGGDDAALAKWQEEQMKKYARLSEDGE
jgi:hypothetical protein